MVAAYIFLPGVVRSVLTLFACVTIDLPAQAPYQANAVGSFWVQDTNQACFAGYHRSCSLGLGISLLFILVLGLPGAAGILTFRIRNKLHEPVLRRHYGFLFNNYRPQVCFWEAIVMLETISLVAVSVFGLTLGPYFQGLVMNACLALILALLCLVRPYSGAHANAALFVGVVCLLMTLLIAQSYLPYGDVTPSETFSIAIAVVLVMLNLSFVVYLIWKLMQAITWRRAKRAWVYCSGSHCCDNMLLPGASAGRSHMPREAAAAGPRRRSRWPKESRSGGVRTATSSSSAAPATSQPVGFKTDISSQQTRPEINPAAIGSTEAADISSQQAVH